MYHTECLLSFLVTMYASGIPISYSTVGIGLNFLKIHNINPEYLLTLQQLNNDSLQVHRGGLLIVTDLLASAVEGTMIDCSMLLGASCVNGNAISSFMLWM
jgi:hypothetical protein